MRFWVLAVIVLAGCATVEPTPADPGIIVKGTVLDGATAEPLAGATVRLVQEGLIKGKDTSAADGTFWMEVPEGPCMLVVDHDDYTRWSLAFDCASNADVTARMVAPEADPVVVDAVVAAAPAEPTFVIAGMVTDQSEAPLNGALVALEQNGSLLASKRTDATGTFAFQAVAGQYDVRAQYPCAVEATHTVTLEADTQLVVALERDLESAPAAPTAVTAASGPGPGMVTVSWEPPEDAVHHYVVLRDGAPHQVIGNGRVWTEHTDAAHEYAVQAIDRCGEDGVASSAVTGEPMPGGAALRTVSVRSDPQASKIHEYPVHVDGQEVRQASWRVVTGLGNCCEVFVHTSPDGRIYEYGGSYMYYSEDGGEQWTQVGNVNIPLGAEGALVNAPNGDVLGFNWDPYTGDQLWVHKYAATQDQWYWQTVPLHQPFYDRPWIGVIEGPFEVGGVTVPYLSYVMSNYVHGSVMLVSIDGLEYFVPSEASIRQGTVTVPDTLPADPSRDWTQSQRENRIYPIDDGIGLRARATLGGCAFAAADGLGWACADWAGLQPAAGSVIRVDGAGTLYALQVDGNGFAIDMQRPDGETGRLRVPLPGGYTLVDYDFKVHAATDQAVIAVSAEDAAGLHQDMALRIRGLASQPYHAETLFVGDGDKVFGSGLTSSETRYDYVTVGITPGGKVAMSMGDGTYDRVVVAIEQ